MVFSFTKNDIWFVNIILEVFRLILFFLLQFKRRDNVLFIKQVNQSDNVELIMVFELSFIVRLRVFINHQIKNLQLDLIDFYFIFIKNLFKQFFFFNCVNSLVLFLFLPDVQIEMAILKQLFHTYVL